MLSDGWKCLNRDNSSIHISKYEEEYYTLYEHILDVMFSHGSVPKDVDTSLALDIARRIQDQGFRYAPNVVSEAVDEISMRMHDHFCHNCPDAYALAKFYMLQVEYEYYKTEELKRNGPQKK